MEDRRPYLGVGAVVVEDGKLLMVQRGKEPAKGRWSVPGGHVEDGEYIVDALQREVREETGLEIEPGELLGIFEVVGERHIVILDYLATVAGDPTPRAGADADDVRWVPLDEVDSLPTTPRFAETLRGWGVLTDE